MISVCLQTRSMQPSRPNVNCRSVFVAVAAMAVASLICSFPAKAQSPGGNLGALLGRLKADEANIASLQSANQALQNTVNQLVSSGANPVGAAGGDLIGSFPNPIIAPNAIDHTKLAFDQASLAQVSGGSLTSVGGNTAHGGLFTMDGSGGSSTAQFTVDGSQQWDFGTRSNGDYFYFGDGSVYALMMDRVHHNVGIYTSTPQNTLDVNGGINANTESHFSAGAYTDPAVGTLQGLKVSGGLAADIVTAHTMQITGGSDLAEPYKITASTGDLKPLPGMVVAIDPDQTGQMRISTHAYDTGVAGIISGANGIKPGVVLRQAGTAADGTLPVASVGRVWCDCDADAGGAIHPGDLLTTSSTPGHAMRVSDYSKAKGSILGKAMSSLKSGKGLVLVLVTLE